MHIRVIEAGEEKKRLPYAKISPWRVGQHLRVPRRQDSQVTEGGLRTSAASQRTQASGPLVSIITACRNAETTIQAAIDSVRGQTYKNVEHIIVDGASTDRTVPIIIANSSDIEYFVSEPDRGIYSAMNKAIVLAQGDYIALLNADDRLFPTFVEESLRALEATGADISYCDYCTEDRTVRCPELNDGLLFSQLFVKHNTFLFRKSCFERIGRFDEDYTIVADAKWNRAAYFSGMKFAKLEEALVFYSAQGGASSGKTAEMRKTTIDESARLIIECFGFLDRNEARSLSTSNFNTNSLGEVLRLYRRYARQYTLFASALREFMRFNFLNREWYLASSDRPETLCRMIDICEAMELPLATIRFERSDDPVRGVLATLDRLGRELSAGELRCVLHFARKFSSSTETFIPAMIKELARRQPERRHVVLCDERLLEVERPYDDVLCVPWESLRGELRSRLYDLIWARLDPQMIVAHFALNGYWFFQRLKDQQKWVPTINVCHGIDVFAIKPGSNYHRYITEYAAPSSRVCFTAVSDYLRNLIIACGVPESKVFRVNNVVTDAFVANRKTGGFYAADRPLRILSVGRLIALKGHDILIRALARAKEKLPRGFSLTIVFGGWDERLGSLKALAADLGIAEAVEFIPFVNFEEETSFHAQFDLFVLPGTLSDDDPPRMEAFGLALLEAIAAGLPVITTTAGGLPEVVGAPNDHAIVVPHGDADALAEAIVRAAENHARVFTDNAAYARERLAEFSADNQCRRWAEAEGWLLQKRPKVYHFSALTQGGAAAATLNIHKGLLEHGYDSVFVTRANQKLSPYTPNVVYLAPEMSFNFDQAQVRHSLKHKYTIFSIDDHIISNETICSLVADADIVNFAWFAQFISTDNIAAVTRMGKPVVVTLRDMNPITGGCHSFHGCEEWRRNCEACPQLKDNSDEFPHFVLRNKIENWNRDAITFVALSEHSRAILEKSSVAKGARIERISNFVDHKTFHLGSKAQARAALNLPNDAFVIGYLPSFNGLVKGHDQLVVALKCLKELRPDRKILVALAADAALPEDGLAFDVVQTGRIADPHALRGFYNAVDVVVVPSLEETFSNTTVEALACGAPVVGFKTGILDELLADERLGAAAPVGDCEGLAQALARFCDVGADPQYCSKVVMEKFSASGQIAKYDWLFRSLMDDLHAHSGAHQPVSFSQIELAATLNAKRAVRKAEGASRWLSRAAHGMRRPSISDYLDCDSEFDKRWLSSHRLKLSVLVGDIPRAARALLRRSSGKGKNGSAQMHDNSFSPDRIPKNIPTPPNFDEEFYLASYPDVKEAVLAKKIPSGYYHYIKFGRLEGRERPTKKEA
jgi:glycosyltransferase involved in cell wall biosynthesis